MKASQINPERFGGEFEDSQKITSGDTIEASKIESFENKTGVRGVSITDTDGKKWHTTAKQPVGYILSEKLNLAKLISEASDGSVTLYFTDKKPENSKRATMLSCSIFG